jgi:DNA primase
VSKPPLLDVLRHYDTDVVEGRVNQLVLCPVHSEDQPSCSVNGEKGVWNCKACNAGGDSYTLIQIKEGLKSFEAVVRFGAEHFGASGPDQPARRGRVGLSGGSGSSRGGFRPAYRRGLGDA